MATKEEVVQLKSELSRLIKIGDSIEQLYNQISGGEMVTVDEEQLNIDLELAKRRYNE